MNARTQNAIRPQAGTLAALLVAAMLTLPAAASAAVVWAADGRHQGPVAIVPDGLTVGKKKIPWADVLVVAAAADSAQTTQGDTVHLVNGEVWTGTVTDMGAGKLTIQSPMLGKQTLAIEQIMAVDFIPNLPAPATDAVKTLYRTKGRPVSGDLVWIKGDKVAVDTPVGAVALDRKDLVRFVFTGKSAVDSETDEVTLTDGSILHGKIAPGASTLILTHASLGNKTLAAGAWTSLRRRVDTVTYLADTPPASVKTFPLIRRPADEPSVLRHRGSDASGQFVTEILVHPKTIATYAAKRTAATVLRTQVALAPGSKGAARVQMRVGDKTVFEQVLTPEKPEATVSAELPGTDALVVEVDFDTVVRLPCRVVLDDPHLIAKK